METAAKAVEFIKEAVAKLTDEKQIDYFTKVAESMEVAKGMIDESGEKEARYKDAAVKFANQLAFILFRADTLGELTDTFRALPSPEETGAKVKEYDSVRQERIDAITSDQQAILKEQRELDIFTAIIAGMTKEEAEAKMAQYEAQMNQMQ